MSDNDIRFFRINPLFYDNGVLKKVCSLEFSYCLFGDGQVFQWKQQSFLDLVLYP